MLPHVLKLGIATACLLASSVTYAATYSMTDEGYDGTFSYDSDTNTNSYTLIGGDGGPPFLNSVINLGGLSGTGTFTRDAGDGNTFSGTLNYTIDSVPAEARSLFENAVNYSGDLQITGGTGIFDGATGTGSFTGTDLYFAIFETDPEVNFRSTARFASIILPTFNGTTSQLVSWSVTTGDVNAVPIPAAAWLFGSGIMGLAGFKRRSKANVA